MRTIIFILFFLFSGASFAYDWSSFTPPPRTIPFTENGVTYHAFVQTRHPWYGQNYIVYYPENIDEDLKPVGVDYNQGPPYQHLWILLNPASHDQAFDSYSYNSNVLVFMCSTNGNGVCQDDTWGNSISSSQIRYQQYTWFDWNYSGPTGYDLQSDLVRAVGIDIKVNFAYDWDGQFGLSNLAAEDVVVTGAAAPSYLSFPLAGNAYTAEVSSVMDQGTLGTNPVYASERNGTVSIFNGESGVVAAGCYCYSTSTTCDSGSYSSCAVPGYMKSGGGSWAFADIITYSGDHVYYDGHPGYDYPKDSGTDILAPADGKLCVATTYTTQQSPVWRNSSECGAIPNVVNERWEDTGGFNAFYILHGSMFMNGSTDEYMTVFLHSNNLESTVLAGIYDDGYKTVTRGQHMADVGGQGPNGPNHFSKHMHIEVYKKVSGTWTRVDPYGNGTSNLLWPKPY